MRPRDESVPLHAPKTNAPPLGASTFAPLTARLSLLGASPLSLRPRFAGPFEVNGVPLRRCNQAYVIATSTKVDVSKVKVPDSIDDGYFSKDNDPEDAKQGDEEKFFATGKKGTSVSEQRKKDQAAVDKALMGKLNDQLKAYLAAKFSLSKGQRPHEMKF